MPRGHTPSEPHLPANRGLVGALAAAWQRHFAWYPGDWIWPVLAFFVLTVVATAAAVAAAPTTEATQPTVSAATATTAPATTAQATVTTAPQPTTTTSPAPPPPPVRPGVAGWPAGRSGYTDVLESIPLSAGRTFAQARARAALREGLPSVGVLVSSAYSSLHSGYYVVFSGVYASSAQASRSLAAAHAAGWSDAYQVRVAR